MNYNQSDPIYKNTKLGFSNKYSLWSDGCYVFSLAYILGIDPIDCNNKLKNAGAFMANGEGDVCLLNHAMIPKAFPNRVVSVAKYDNYDNDAALEAIEKNGKVIVKVDFDGSNSTTMDTHFLTFNGDKKCFDSLGGKIKPTSTYPLLKGLRVINLKDETSGDLYRGYDLNNSDSMKVCVDKMVEIMEGKYISIDEHNKVINELDTKSTDQANQYGKDKQILEEKIRTLEDIIEQLQKTEHSWSDTADILERKLSAVLGELQKSGLSISIENNVADLANSVSVYISNLKDGSKDILALSQALEKANKEILKLKSKETAFRTINIGNIIIKFFYK